LYIVIFLSKEYGLFFQDFKVEMVISFQNYEEKEVGSIMAIRIGMAFVLSGGIWMVVLYPGGLRD
jgi:hypothetical protein